MKVTATNSETKARRPILPCGTDKKDNKTTNPKRNKTLIIDGGKGNATGPTGTAACYKKRAQKKGVRDAHKSLNQGAYLPFQTGARFFGKGGRAFAGIFE